MDLLEGGIRVPLLARWHGRLSAGSTSAQLTITMDWVNAFLHYAGVAADPKFPLDGRSLHENLSKPDTVNSRTLFWRMKYLDQRAVREDNWKYLAIGDDEYLFDIEADAR